MKKLGYATLAAALLLQGCGGPSAKCDDAAVMAKVEETFLGLIKHNYRKPTAAKDEFMNGLKVSVSSITMEQADAEIGKYWCKADLQASLQPGPLTEMIKRGAASSNEPTRVNGYTTNNNPIQITADALMSSITYTAQLTEDKQPKVEMDGWRPMAEAIVFGLDYF